MIELLFIVIAFIILLLVVVWAHFINQNKYRNKVDNTFRDATNVRLYKEHKEEIETDFKQGCLDQESYDYLLSELDQSLLQDIEENSREKTQVVEHKPLSIVWPVMLSVFLIGFSAYMYVDNGAYSLIVNTPKQNPNSQGQNQEAQLKQQIATLKQQVTQKPEDSDAWYALGQASVGLGDFDGALKAFDKVIEIDGEMADLFGAKAQASFYKNNQQITPEVQALIDKALSIDARDPSTNILLGMNAFLNNEYQQAVDYWQQVITDNRPSVNVEALKGALAEAKSRLALTGDEGEQASVSGPQLTLDVSLSEEVLQKLAQGQDKVVFVYAIASEGSRMPLAAVKLNASDLPTRIVLNDSRAMTPQAKLSDVNQVSVIAIVSNSGSAGIKPGDFKGELAQVNVTEKNPIQLVINSVVEAPAKP